MSNPKTIATELAVACGLLNTNGLSRLDMGQIKGVDKASITSAQDYIDKEGADIVNAMCRAGALARAHLPCEPAEVRWGGPIKKSAAITFASDVSAFSNQKSILEVSVKCDSLVMLNMGMGRLAELFSTGTANSSSKGTDWYQLIAPDALQRLYEKCDGPSQTGLLTVSEYYIKVKDKKPFSKHCKEVVKTNPSLNSEFSSEVSLNSMKTLKAKLDLLDASRYSLIFKQLFRLDSLAYVIAGTDNGKPFAFLVPDYDAWSKEYKVAKVDLSVGSSLQPEVHITFNIEKKSNPKRKLTLVFRVEIRWSHGKFGGNPEGKVYRKFNINEEEIPWLKLKA